MDKIFFLLKVAVRVPLLCTNFITVIWHLQRKTSKSVYLLKTKSGEKYFIRPGFEDVMVLEEIYLDKEYTLDSTFTPRANEIVLDFGAYIGDFLVLASRLVGKNGRVIAFEPIPLIFEIAKKNIELNGLKNVDLMQTFVDSESKEMIFRVNSLFAGASSSLSVQNNLSKNTQEIKVRSLSYKNFEQLIPSRNDIFCKIDIEGAEFNLLPLFSDKLWKQIRVIIIEYHLNDSKSVEELTKILDNNNFKYEVVPHKSFLSIGMIYAKREDLNIIQKNP